MKLLVYGTLRRGETNHNKLAESARFIKTVRVPGYSMYNVHWFPGVVRNPADEEGIVCELYAVNPEVIDDLDFYEGYDPLDPLRSLFVRRTIELDGGVRAQIYTYNMPTEPLVQIVGGDYCENKIDLS